MKFVDESGGFASIAQVPFGRRGSYLTVNLHPGASEHFGRAYVYIGTCHGSATSVGKSRLFNIMPIYEGERVPFAVIMKPAELILRTLYGDVRICIAENKLMLFKGENKVGLRLDPHDDGVCRLTKKRGNTAFESQFNVGLNTVVNSITGSINGFAPWDFDRLRCKRSYIELLSDENGVMEGSLEEFTHCGYIRQSYPSYEKALLDTEKDFETFLNNIPPLPEKYEELRVHAARNLWSYTVSPSGLIKRNMLFMSRNGPASQWQHTFQSAAFGCNTELGWDQFMNPFEHQSETGQLPDFYDDNRGNFSTIRPPIHGWALQLLKRLSYYDKIPKEEKMQLYPKLKAWADWFTKYRVEDGADGLPHYEQSDESGMEDGTTFRESCCMVTPDLPAYLVLLYEQLGELSAELGMDSKIKEAWYKKAEEMKNRLIEKLWDGEKFVSHTVDGKCIEKDYGILGYLPIVLGHRLPDDILKKLVGDLKKEGYILSEYGFDKEKICARDLCDVGMSSVRGYEYQPFNVVLISALYYDCGEKEFAKDVARRFCDGMLFGGGIGAVLNTFTGSVPSQWVSWSAGAYLLIAGMTE